MAPIISRQQATPPTETPSNLYQQNLNSLATTIREVQNKLSHVADTISQLNDNLTKLDKEVKKLAYMLPPEGEKRLEPRPAM
jgi:peptidoglycan hydrolase CwlO-like protein